MNARFWTNINCGPVKLTLKPGHTLHWHTSGPTDEGWFADGGEWFFDGSTVWASWWSDERGCDGRLQQYGVSTCPVDKLAVRDLSEFSEFVGILFPDWQGVDSGQRDEYAEAMGY